LSNKRNKLRELFTDHRVQLLLGKFLSGELGAILPVLDRDLGYRYPDVEPFMEKPREAEAFLKTLQKQGLMASETAGFVAYCEFCGSCNVKERPPKEGENPSNDGEIQYSCIDCGKTFAEGTIKLRKVHSYTFSEAGIDEISDRLIVRPLKDFLNERGYQSTSPGKMEGESNVEHVFDFVAYSGNPSEGVLVIDFVVSDSPVGEDHVASMFAKVYDTTPLRAVLIVFPELTRDARKLAEQYKINVVETKKLESLWVELRHVIPTVDDFRFEPLDVMTLLSLPDHLRKTATVTSSLGKATADEIAELTKRARAVESGYLNQLVRMGYLKKERIGRKVLFSVVT
jgi:hypothetical protein